MRKTLILSVLSLLLMAQLDAATPARSFLINTLTQQSITTSYNVRIKLVSVNGTPVESSRLRGYWATNVQTGDLYESDREGDEITGLPAGTYTFGGYPGNWDGAVSKTVTLDDSQVGADGFIEITLVYWVE